MTSKLNEVEGEGRWLPESEPRLMKTHRAGTCALILLQKNIILDSVAPSSVQYTLSRVSSSVCEAHGGCSCASIL